MKKHLHDSIISLRGEIGAYKASLTLPLFIAVHVPSVESERSYIRALGVSNCIFLQFVYWILELSWECVWYFFVLFFSFKVVPYISGKIWSARLIFLFAWQCVLIYPL